MPDRDLARLIRSARSVEESASSRGAPPWNRVAAALGAGAAFATSQGLAASATGAGQKAAGLVGKAAAFWGTTLGKVSVVVGTAALLSAPTAISLSANSKPVSSPSALESRALRATPKATRAAMGDGSERKAVNSPRADDTRAESGDASGLPTTDTSARKAAAARQPAAAQDLAAATKHTPVGDMKPPSDTLSREVDLIGSAKRALDAGDARGALSMVARYQAEFPSGVLRSEAQATRTLALCALGQASNARQAAQGLDPNSALGKRLRGGCPQSR